MNDRKFLFGVVVSFFWGGLVAWLFVVTKKPVELNQWGDFFAGVFAPLAFLWLVLGYLQQGTELRLSTEALRLQAEELSKSVEQQSQLVMVSREQMAHEMEVIREDRERRKDAARPKFVPQASGSVSSGGVVTHKVKIVNVGNTATRFRMKFDPPILSHSNLNFALVARDEALAFDLQFGDTNATTATVTYVDSDGMPGEVRFELEVRKSLRFGNVERVA